MNPQPTPARNAQNPAGEPNLDPLSGEPGAHPVGTGIGAASGGAAGAAIGAAVGPVGALVGTIVGAVAGGLAGKGVAENIDPTAEEAFWRANHGRQPYAKGRDYPAYESAYRTGVTGYTDGRTFEEQEAALRRQYEDEISRDVDAEARRGDATAKQLEWEEARHASRAAYERLAQKQAKAASEAPTVPMARPPVV